MPAPSLLLLSHTRAPSSAPHHQHAVRRGRARMCSVRGARSSIDTPTLSVSSWTSARTCQTVGYCDFGSALCAAMLDDIIPNHTLPMRGQTSPPVHSPLLTSTNHDLQRERQAGDVYVHLVSTESPRSLSVPHYCGSPQTGIVPRGRHLRARCVCALRKQSILFVYSDNLIDHSTPARPNWQIPIRLFYSPDRQPCNTRRATGAGVCERGAVRCVCEQWLFSGRSTAHRIGTAAATERQVAPRSACARFHGGALAPVPHARATASICVRPICGALCGIASHRIAVPAVCSHPHTHARTLQVVVF